MTFRHLPTGTLRKTRMRGRMEGAAATAALVATAAAMDSGEAPGRLAVTWMVGKSTLGSSETGSAR